MAEYYNDEQLASVKEAQSMADELNDMTRKEIQKDIFKNYKSGDNEKMVDRMFDREQVDIAKELKIEKTKAEDKKK